VTFVKNYWPALTMLAVAALFVGCALHSANEGELEARPASPAREKRQEGREEAAAAPLRAAGEVPEERPFVCGNCLGAKPLSEEEQRALWREERWRDIEGEIHRHRLEIERLERLLLAEDVAEYVRRLVRGWVQGLLLPVLRTNADNRGEK
jgi:hypothetical protein